MAAELTPEVASLGEICRLLGEAIERTEAIETDVARLLEAVGERLKGGDDA